MPRPSLGDPAMLLATVGGVGLLPAAPGTCGSLVGVALAWALPAPHLLIPVCAILFTLGLWASEHVARRSGIADPGFIVIDEVVGQALVLALAPPSPWVYATGFVLFRIADIFKPWPIRDIETKFRNGFGIMVDDVAAAVYAGAALLIGLKIYPELTHGT
ncbi:MAG TPA: phosphatidylglycerophosphatase A [Stellaceae bacterium]|nr:phosphatidylglycerophosphatase A [Stellaceae bacterium]